MGTINIKIKDHFKTINFHSPVTFFPPGPLVVLLLLLFESLTFLLFDDCHSWQAQEKVIESADVLHNKS